MTLKIIGGTFKNRPLKTPKGPQTRPSLAIMRKAVFDILQQDIIDADFLDLFAGTGAMGIEAISRGAHHATFIDQDRQALSCIKENIQTFQIDPQTTVIPADALRALQKLSTQGTLFDIIYIDPPYALSPEKSFLLSLLTFLDTHPLLKSSATVFLEEGAPAHLNPQSLTLKHLHHLNSRKFSHSILHQFHHNMKK